LGVKKVCPLEIADYVFCPHKKITSRKIRNSGALIVKIQRLPVPVETILSEPIPIPVTRLNVKAGVALKPLEVAENVFLERLNK
jgi:hypothetical protein